MGAYRRNGNAEISLAGLRVLVTRPSQQAESLCHMIQAAGGRAMRLPVLEIREPEDSRRLDALIDRLHEFNLAIFVSANAVHYAVPRIRARAAKLERLRLATVGRKTAAVLSALGYRVGICPSDDFTSEALLGVPEMKALRGCDVIIFRGEGGRELLAETLRARGARVEYAEVYRRGIPRPDLRILNAWFRDRSSALITMTSEEGLRNLYDMCKPPLRKQLLQSALLAGGHRLCQSAMEMGFTTVLAAGDPTDEAMFEGVLKWAESNRSTGG